MEEQVKEQYQFPQTVRQVNQSVQAPHRQSRQHPSEGQVRSNRCSGYNGGGRDLENNQIGREATTDRYPMEAKHILQRIEQENSVGYHPIGKFPQSGCYPNNAVRFSKADIPPKW